MKQFSHNPDATRRRVVFVLFAMGLSAPASATILTDTGDPSVLAERLLVDGTGLTVVSADFTGNLDAAGLFSDGPLGLADGIVLSTGHADLGLNPANGAASWDNQAAFHALCGGLSAFDTLDAAVLTLTVEVGENTQAAAIDLAFGTEEFPEFLGQPFVDVVGVFVDGVPVLVDPDGAPLGLGSDLLADGTALEPATSGLDWDGLSPPITAVFALTGGTTQDISLVVCDVTDALLDSGLLLARLRGVVVPDGGPSLPFSAPAEFVCAGGTDEDDDTAVDCADTDCAAKCAADITLVPPTPVTTEPGVTVAVVVEGTGFFDGLQVDTGRAGPAVTVVDSAVQLTAQVQVNSDAAYGCHDVRVGADGEWSILAGALCILAPGAQLGDAYTVSSEGSEPSLLSVASTGGSVLDTWVPNANVPSASDELTMRLHREVSGELNVVVIIDENSDGSGGNLTLNIDGPPGIAWLVCDDPTECSAFDAGGHSTTTWTWGGCCTDGGVVGPLGPTGCTTMSVTAMAGLDTWRFVGAASEPVAAFDMLAKVSVCPSFSGTTSPTVVAVEPTQLVVGETTVVEVSGTGFDLSTDVQFGAGVTVVSVDVNSSSALIAVVAVGGAADLGTRSVGITTGAGSAVPTETLGVDQVELVAFLDADKDGSADADDCEPNNQQIFPGQTEACDGIDNDCDQVADGALADGWCPGETICDDAACGFPWTETVSATPTIDGAFTGWSAGQADTEWAVHPAVTTPHAEVRVTFDGTTLSLMADVVGLPAPPSATCRALVHIVVSAEAGPARYRAVVSADSFELALDGVTVQAGAGALGIGGSPAAVGSHSRLEMAVPAMAGHFAIALQYPGEAPCGRLIGEGSAIFGQLLDGGGAMVFASEEWPQVAGVVPPIPPAAGIATLVGGAIDSLDVTVLDCDGPIPAANPTARTVSIRVPDCVPNSVLLQADAESTSFPWIAMELAAGVETPEAIVGALASTPTVDGDLQPWLGVPIFTGETVFARFDYDSDRFTVAAEWRSGAPQCPVGFRLWTQAGELRWAVDVVDGNTTILLHGEPASGDAVAGFGGTSLEPGSHPTTELGLETGPGAFAVQMLGPAPDCGDPVAEPRVFVGRLEANGGLRVAPTLGPVILGISKAGTLGPGQTVTLTGVNFGEDVGGVTFDGQAATVISWSDSAVTVAVPLVDDGLQPFVLTAESDFQTPPFVADFLSPDSDEDGVDDIDDNCVDMANPDQDDFDQDSLGDVCDPDDDDDNTPDVEDVFPFDPDESKDDDADGTGNNADCGPNNDQVAPGKPELCDGLDNDCDGTTDGDPAHSDCTAPQVCADGQCDYAWVTSSGGPALLIDGLEPDWSAIDGVAGASTDVRVRAAAGHLAVFVNAPLNEQKVCRIQLSGRIGSDWWTVRGWSNGEVDGLHNGFEHAPDAAFSSGLEVRIPAVPGAFAFRVQYGCGPHSEDPIGFIGHLDVGSTRLYANASEPWLLDLAPASVEGGDRILLNGVKLGEEPDGMSVCGVDATIVSWHSSRVLIELPATAGNCSDVTDMGGVSAPGPSAGPTGWVYNLDRTFDRAGPLSEGGFHITPAGTSENLAFQVVGPDEYTVRVVGTDPMDAYRIEVAGSAWSAWNRGSAVDLTGSVSESPNGSDLTVAVGLGHGPTGVQAVAQPGASASTWGRLPLDGGADLAPTDGPRIYGFDIYDAVVGETVLVYGVGLGGAASATSAFIGDESAEVVSASADGLSATIRVPNAATNGGLLVLAVDGVSTNAIWLNTGESDADKDGVFDDDDCDSLDAAIGPCVVSSAFGHVVDGDFTAFDAGEEWSDIEPVVLDDGELFFDVVDDRLFIMVTTTRGEPELSDDAWILIAVRSADAYTWFKLYGDGRLTAYRQGIETESTAAGARGFGLTHRFELSVDIGPGDFHIHIGIPTAETLGNQLVFQPRGGGGRSLGSGHGAFNHPEAPGLVASNSGSAAAGDVVAFHGQIEGEITADGAALGTLWSGPGRALVTLKDAGGTVALAGSSLNVPSVQARSSRVVLNPSAIEVPVVGGGAEDAWLQLTPITVNGVRTFFDYQDGLLTVLTTDGSEETVVEGVFDGQRAFERRAPGGDAVDWSVSAMPRFGGQQTLEFAVEADSGEVALRIRTGTASTVVRGLLEPAGGSALYRWTGPVLLVVDPSETVVGEVISLRTHAAGADAGTVRLGASTLEVVSWSDEVVEARIIPGAASGPIWFRSADALESNRLQLIVLEEETDVTSPDMGAELSEVAEPERVEQEVTSLTGGGGCGECQQSGSRDPMWPTPLLMVVLWFWMRRRSRMASTQSRVVG